MHRYAAEGFATPISQPQLKHHIVKDGEKLTGPIIVACQWNYSERLAVCSNMSLVMHRTEASRSHDNVDSRVLIGVGEG